MEVIGRCEGRGLMTEVSPWMVTESDVRRESTILSCMQLKDLLCHVEDRGNWRRAT